MDPQVSWAILSFLIGIGAGFKDLYERYPDAFEVAAGQWPGTCYLLSRGVLPAAVFVVLFETGVIATRLPLQALAIGTGAELFLRSSFLVKTAQKPAGTIDEVLKGPLDLFRWYQDFFLITLLSDRVAARKNEWMKNNLPPGTFDALCARVIGNLDVLQAEDQRRKQIVSAITTLEQEREREKNAGSDSATLDAKYRRKLGFAVLNRAGRTLFVTLFAVP